MGTIRRNFYEQMDPDTIPAAAMGVREVWRSRIDALIGGFESRSSKWLESSYG